MINWYSERAGQEGLRINSVRAIFEEGKTTFEASAIRTLSHVQIAVRGAAAAAAQPGEPSSARRVRMDSLIQPLRSSKVAQGGWSRSTAATTSSGDALARRPAYM